MVYSLTDEKLFLEESLKDTTSNKSLNNETDDNLTDCEAFFSICNGIMGTGILAMGFVFRCAGLWALLIVPIVAVAGNYTGKLLIGMLYDENKDGTRCRTREGYQDLGEYLIPRFGRCVVNVVNSIENFAHAVLVLLLAGGVMHEIVPAVGDHLWTVLCAIPVLPVIFIERIRSLTKVAMATVITATILVAINIVYSLHFTGKWKSTMKMATIFELRTVSLAIGVTIVTYACQPYLPFIEKNMAKKENFSKVMNISYILVTILKIACGLLAYLAFENLTPPLLTSDLPHGPLRTASSLILLIVALTFFIFPMFTVFNILDESWPNLKNDYSLKKQHFIRSIILFLAVSAAVVTPHFGLGVALVGNLTANILMFILPCSCHIKFHYPNISRKELFIDVLLLIISTIFGSIGIIFSLLELVMSFKNDDENPTEPLEKL